jgi:sugar/nucleoside kinase (ribokinase family)
MSAAQVMLDAGVKNVVITLGSKGCFYTDGEVKQIVKPLPSNMVNGNGAGDALLSGLATGFCRGYSLADSVMLGMASASITLETRLTNNPSLSFEAALERAQIEK